MAFSPHRRAGISMKSILSILLLFNLPFVLAKYVTQPDFEVTNINVTYQDKNIEPADGYIFLSPRLDGPQGLTILDKNLELVYLNATVPRDVMYFKPQELHGEPVIVYFNGTMLHGSDTRGKAVIMNQNYTLRNVVESKYHLDGHDVSTTLVCFSARD